MKDINFKRAYNVTNLERQNEFGVDNLYLSEFQQQINDMKSTLRTVNELKNYITNVQESMKVMHEITNSVKEISKDIKHMGPINESIWEVSKGIKSVYAFSDYMNEIKADIDNIKTNRNETSSDEVKEELESIKNLDNLGEKEFLSFDLNSKGEYKKGLFSEMEIK